MNFRQNLKTLIKENNFTQKKLSELLNINIETLRRIIQGKQKSIDIELIYKLSEIFNCDFNRLFK